MSNKLIVFGSVNVDLVVRVAALPRPGETVSGDRLSVFLGGKGANQAVAAARAGASVAMVGAIGAQSFGLDIRAEMAGYGVDMSAVETTDAPTGAALIAVDEAGENSIVVSPGANAEVSGALPEVGAGDIVMAQFEVPLNAVARAFETAKAAGATTVLNAAPAKPAPAALLDLVDVLIVNETELSVLSGAALARLSDRTGVIEAAGALRRRPAQRIVATLGAAGALALDGEAIIETSAFPADVVDTTGAGDCFCGAFAAALGSGAPLSEAMRFAAAAAAVSVETAGAAPSMPNRAQILERLGAAEITSP